MNYFYARYYTAVTLGTVCNILTGICLIFVSYKGWRRVNPYMLNAFVVLSSSAVFLGAMPPTLKLEQNISENKALYLKYVSLENEILSYQITEQTINRDQVGLDDFIHYLDQELAKNNQLAIGFDATSIPKYQDLYKELPK